MNVAVQVTLQVYSLFGMKSNYDPSYRWNDSDPWMDMDVHIVLCCGAKMVLFTSECWCRIINPYLFTKLYTYIKHLGKRVTQTLFFVVVRKGYCLPTSYQNVGVISLIPTCLPSFIHPSI